jgi:microcystin-dependent protein
VGNPQRYSFVAPSDQWVVEAIIGMLVDYSNIATWYQEGTATIEEAAAIFASVWNTFGVDMATTGVIVPFAGGILPIGWLVCDGSSLDRAAYANLFAAIGTVWGAADSTHFNIPDLRGRTLLGQGLAGSGTTFGLGSVGGEETHTLTTAEMPTHNHTYTPPGAPIVVTPAGVPANSPALLPANTGDTGGGGPHNNLQPYAVVNYAIIT